MLTMNRTLDEKISSVDRVYLTDTDLVNLERFANSFSVRVRTYNLLRDLADEITVRSLKQLAQKHLQRCKYDMSNMIRYTSLAVLRDDELFFRETLMDWLANIINSYQVVISSSN